MLIFYNIAYNMTSYKPNGYFDFGDMQHVSIHINVIACFDHAMYCFYTRRGATTYYLICGSVHLYECMYICLSVMTVSLLRGAIVFPKRN